MAKKCVNVLISLKKELTLNLSDFTEKNPREMFFLTVSGK